MCVFLFSQLSPKFFIPLFSFLRKADHILLNTNVAQLSNSMKNLCNCQDASELQYEQIQNNLSQAGLLPLGYGIYYFSGSRKSKYIQTCDNLWQDKCVLMLPKTDAAELNTCVEI